jgi:hypothetical protein
MPATRKSFWFFSHGQFGYRHKAVNTREIALLGYEFCKASAASSAEISLNHKGDAACLLHFATQWILNGIILAVTSMRLMQCEVETKT